MTIQNIKNTVAKKFKLFAFLNMLTAMVIFAITAMVCIVSGFRNVIIAIVSIYYIVCCFEWIACIH